MRTILDTELKVAPEILRIAGDVGRPQSPVPFATQFGNLPGDSGLLAGIRTVIGTQRQGEAYYTELVRRYGPIFRGRLGPSPLVYVADADLVWNVLRNEERVWSSALPWTYFLGGMHDGATSDGLTMLDFDFHRDGRRLLQPAFSSAAHGDHVATAQKIYERTIERWLSAGRVKFKPELRRMFAAVSASIFMGLEDPVTVEKLNRAMADGWRGVLAFLKRSRLSPRWGTARRGYQILWNMVRPRFDSPSIGKDLLSRLVATQDEGEWLDTDTRARMFIMMMFGAFDTTASSSTSMAYLLAKHSDWQERLRKEAVSLAAERPGPELLRGLEIQERVWKESLRLFPVAATICRQSLCEVELGPHRLPPATLVMLMTSTLGRDPKWWTEPLRFDPDRFLPERAEEKRHKAIYLPFGAGAHACIGAQLASVEVKAFWHMFLSRCSLRFAKEYEGHHTYVPLGIVNGDVELLVDRIR